MMMDINDLHAQHVTAVTSQATSAAWHADIAAKQAASLAQWVQYLWSQVATLQHEVKELEEWKKKTLEDMSKLRFAHKLLQRKVMPDAAIDDFSPTKSKNTSFDSQKDESPPELKAKAKSQDPPGLEQQERPGLSKAMSGVSVVSGFGDSPSDSMAVDEGLLEGVNVTRACVDGVERECAQWRIGHLSAKLKNCMGRSLVSSPFSAWGLDDLRLMVFPDGKEAVKGTRSKKQKEQYAKMVTDGPLEGCLKFKVPECPAPHILEYYLKIGEVRKGPFRHDFSESTVNGCSDFSVDWLKQVDADQILTVTVEILEPVAS